MMASVWKYSKLPDMASLYLKVHIWWHCRGFQKKEAKEAYALWLRMKLALKAKDKGLSHQLYNEFSIKTEAGGISNKDLNISLRDMLHYMPDDWW